MSSDYKFYYIIYFISIDRFLWCRLEIVQKNKNILLTFVAFQNNFLKKNYAFIL